MITLILKVQKLNKATYFIHISQQFKSCVFLINTLLTKFGKAIT